MPACFSCHSLSEKTKTYRVYYGAKSFKVYEPGNYEEYNKKAISEKVVSDEVRMCSKCMEKAGYHSKYQYAVKIWSQGVGQTTGLKCCHQCYHISESMSCDHYKYFIPWWVKHVIDIDKIEPVIDLSPVKHTVHCIGWKPLNSVNANSRDSLKCQFRMGFYLFRYYRKTRKKLKTFLFQDLFSLNEFIDEIQSFLSSNSAGSIIDRSYSRLVYRPYRNILGSNIYKKYCDTRAKLKDWAEALS